MHIVTYLSDMDGGRAVAAGSGSGSRGQRESLIDIDFSSPLFSAVGLAPINMNKWNTNITKTQPISLDFKLSSINSYPQSPLSTHLVSSPHHPIPPSADEQPEEIGVNSGQKAACLVIDVTQPLSFLATGIAPIQVTGVDDHLIAPHSFRHSIPHTLDTRRIEYGTSIRNGPARDTSALPSYSAFKNPLSSIAGSGEEDVFRS